MVIEGFLVLFLFCVTEMSSSLVLVEEQGGSPLSGTLSPSVADGGGGHVLQHLGWLFGQDSWCLIS